MKIATSFIVSGFLCATAFAAETKVKIEDLPAPVQNTIKEQTKDVTLVGVTKEKEGGKIVYELETTANGKARDLTMDATGAIISVEQEVDLEAVPAAAQAAIQKKAAGGKITKVETVTKGSVLYYETAYTSKSGKKAEYSVNADGTPHK